MSTLFVCDRCGAEYSKWQGKCDACNSWNSLKELKISDFPKSSKIVTENIKPKKISDIKIGSNFRVKSNISELDLVLGGGFVEGEICLLAGEPGIGKSTLMLEIASKIKNSLYISAEESLEQIKSRWQRLKLKNNNSQFVSTENLDAIISTISKINPQLVIVDSIQAIADLNLANTAGSQVQVKNCSLRLQKVAKEQKCTILISSHVTKSGIIAGPKTLEHLVDAVFYLEGARDGMYRILRSVKNRYGSANEIGVFEMTSFGLKEASNSESVFLNKKILGEVGVVTTSVLEGNRPMIIEVQALAAPSYLNFPKRTASGIDLKRVSLLAAVIEGRTSNRFGKYDLFFNMPGGIKPKDNSIDLAIILALISAVWKKPVSNDLLAIGEVGLTGEVRVVPMIERRIIQAKKMGFNQFIIPETLEIKNKKHQVKNIHQAIKIAFGKGEK